MFVIAPVRRHKNIFNAIGPVLFFCKLKNNKKNIEFCFERHVSCYHTVEVMVWDFTAYRTRSSLVFIRGSTTDDATLYSENRATFLPFLRTLKNPIFQEDNARLHIARITKNHLNDAQVNLLSWPSSDLLSKCGISWGED